MMEFLENIQLTPPEMFKSPTILTKTPVGLIWSRTYLDQRESDAKKVLSETSLQQAAEQHSSVFVPSCNVKLPQWTRIGHKLEALLDKTFVKDEDNTKYLPKCVGFVEDNRLANSTPENHIVQEKRNAGHKSFFLSEGYNSDTAVIEMDGNVYDRVRDPPGQQSVYIPPGDSFKESYRLSTFTKYPQEVPVSPTHLASAGFLYTGYKDRVKCFSCGLCCESWVYGDDVRSAKWHRIDCAFTRGGDSENVPIGESGHPQDLDPTNSTTYIAELTQEFCNLTMSPDSKRVEYPQPSAYAPNSPPRSTQPCNPSTNPNSEQKLYQNKLNLQELQEERKCKVCLDNIADIVFVPCGHLCGCGRCAEALRRCPMCRMKIEKAIRTYMS